MTMQLGPQSCATFASRVCTNIVARASAMKNKIAMAASKFSKMVKK